LLGDASNFKANLNSNWIFATDVDLDVRIDLQDLQDEFDFMTSSQMIGVVNDQE
jgi:hypothetical protein